MNIVVLSDSLFPDAVTGAFHYAYDVAQRLAARGHRCWAISAHPGDGRPYHEQVGAVEYHRYPLRRGNHAFSFASRLTGSLKAMQKIARRHSIDVLYPHGPMGAVGAFLAPAARPLPRLATLHGTGVLDEYLCELAPLAARRSPTPPERLYCRTMDRVERWYLRRIHWLHALSRFSRDFFVDHHGLNPNRTSIIPPGVDLERFRPGPRDAARRHLGLPADRPILLSVRRLTARMGLDRLIRATKSVADRYPEALLLIGGKGPMRSHLEQLITELRLEANVSLCGFIPDEQLPLYYQAADLFVIPSIAAEGFGLVSIEALACDLPVLGTPSGGITEVLSAIDAELLFPDTSPEAMSAHIVAWLQRVVPTGHWAPGTGHRAEGARPLPSLSYRERVAERFNWARSMAALERLFEEVRQANKR